MPQGQRSVAFSGKKKKEQLKARKERKVFIRTGEEPKESPVQHRGPVVPQSILTQLRQDGAAAGVDYMAEVEAINRQPDTRGTANRYNLKFRKETKEEAKRRKALHYVEIDTTPETDLEAPTESFYPPGLGYPARPQWTKTMSKRELDASENRHFRLFSERLDQEFAGSDLSLYELNLETWRQLWRVTEMSDVLLIIVDARYPVAQFPPYLYRHLTEQEDRGTILVLNKCDLIPPAAVVAWEHYFHQTFPKLLVVPFSSLEGRVHPRGQLRMAAESSLRLVGACQELVKGSVDLTKWKNKIEEEREMEWEGECEADEEVRVEGEAPPSTQPLPHQRYKDGILTLGTIGHPNVGKSSLINALMGKKVVSVSKTPGHTKHFQTIFLTKNVKLCDCPGLVFPSTLTRPMQVLTGSYPISQEKDPIGVVHYIATRLDIPCRLGLDSVRETCDWSTGNRKWTAYEICEAWATKRGYFMRTRGGPDVFRAANELLRFCLNGQKSLVLYLRPPGYSREKEIFKSDPRVEEIKLIQGSLCQGKTAAEEEEEEEEEETHERDSEQEAKVENKNESHRPNIQNKFSLLAVDE